jgi:hypothetical protein
MKCSQCDEDHVLLDPVFRRPEAVVILSDEERAFRVKDGNDVCFIREDASNLRIRYFVRCVLKVRLLDAEGESAWGIWAEVGEADCRRILDAWTDPDQAALPAMEATIANRVPGYPDTLGLPATLRLTGPTTRPALELTGDSIHPFAREVHAGVCTHRVMEWLEDMR